MATFTIQYTRKYYVDAETGSQALATLDALLELGEGITDVLAERASIGMGVSLAKVEQD